LVIRYWILGIHFSEYPIINIQSAVRRLKNNHEMFRANFRGFIFLFFRDEKKNIEHPTSNIEF